MVGPGKIAAEVARDLALIGKNFTAVASNDHARAQKFAGEHSVERVYESYESMFSDSNIDAVYIANINPQHYPMAKLALQHGKHVLVEKPFVLNSKQARELYSLAKEQNAFIMEALWSRFLDHWLELPGLVEKHLGRIVSVEADFSVEISHVKRLTELELGGGALLDLGVYPLSLVQMLMGKAESIKAEGELQNGVDKNLEIYLGFANGARATISTGFDRNGPVTANIIGETGTILIDSRFYEQAKLRVMNDDSEVVYELSPNHLGRGMQQQFLGFEAVVEAGRLEAENFTQRDSLDVLEMMDDIRNQLGVVYPGE